MKNKHVASPYTYGRFSNPTSWGIWNKETKSWMPDMPTPRKRDAERDAKAMNELEDWEWKIQPA